MNRTAKKTLSQGPFLVLFSLLASGWLAAQPRKTIDFSRLVVVGDSLAAGVENGSLEDTQQLHGFANLIAQQANTHLQLPLIFPPGAPNTLELVSAGFPPVIAPAPGTLPLIPREDPLTPVTDVAVPLQTVADALNRLPNADFTTTDETQLATNLVLGFPCPILLSCTPLTQVQQAVALRPTAVIVDIGNNDILGAVTSGGLPSLLSSPGAFFANFNKSYASLMNQLAATKATLVVANIPDVMKAAYFIPVWKLAAAAKFPLLQVTRALGLRPLDYVTLDAVPTVAAILSGAASGPLPLFCSTTSSTTPCYVTLEQALEVRLVTVGLNAIIQVQALAHGAVVVDLFSLIDNLYAHGYKVGSETLTTDFLGGLFSLDGLHPTNSGYAIMANQFIQTINTAFKTNISAAVVPDISGDYPTFP
jgi:lysophospholipase L1-like esterase